jgi:hypothetical protein
MAPIALELEGIPRRDSVTPIVRAAGLWEASAAFGGRLTLLGFDRGCGVWSLQIERSRRKVSFLVDNERPRSGVQGADGDVGRGHANPPWVSVTVIS